MRRVDYLLLFLQSLINPFIIRFDNCAADISKQERVTNSLMFFFESVPLVFMIGKLEVL